MCIPQRKAFLKYLKLTLVVLSPTESNPFSSKLGSFYANTTKRIFTWQWLA